MRWAVRRTDRAKLDELTMIFMTDCKLEAYVELDWESAESY